MSLINHLSTAHAELESRRDVDSALRAFAVLREAAWAMEEVAPREEFPAWVYAGQAASEGVSALVPVATTPFTSPEVGEEIGEGSAVAESMAALGALLREVMADAAHENEDPDARLASLVAARCGTQIQTLLGE